MDKNTFLDHMKPFINTDCGTYDTQGVAKIADMISDKYRALGGWHISRKHLHDEVGPGLLLTNRENPEHFDVLLIGHLDTVFPQGTAAERPFRVEGNRAYGPGVADMKNGIIAIYAALAELDPALRDALSIGVLHNPDEEIGSIHSAEWIVEVAKKADRVLVCESARADGSLVSQRKGYANFTLQFKGIASHAGNDPEKGRSAVLEMAHWICDLTRFNDYANGTSLTVGLAKGGSASNVVPEHAEAIVDMRFWDNAKFEEIHNILLEKAKTPHVDGVAITVSVKSHKPAMIMNDGTKALMQLVEKAGESIGLPITWQAVGGGSDANLTSSHGIPSLDGFGPIGANFHSDKEYLEIDSIEARVALLKAVLEAVAKSK
ncbi:MAG: M20 family metallopeptidase [Cardiobacteriaceae bacterium]|nr:M20 family metallopeptidase [Cardiobacteriaceae bacterium]